MDCWIAGGHYSTTPFYHEQGLLFSSTQERLKTIGGVVGAAAQAKER